VTHGIACSLTLAEFLLYNFNVNQNDCLHPQGSKFVKTKILEISRILAGKKDVEAAAKFIAALQKKLDVAPALRDWGVSGADISKLPTQGLNVERLSNNPRKVDFDEAIRIYTRVF
jgi:alcohol dehydrogenase class IV